jgi:uncharacterized protein with NRDE domain
MCLLALFFRAVEDAALVAGANREECYRRGGEPPRLLLGKLRAVAGVDPAAGGTWFGVNEKSVLIAVTNREKSGPPPTPRSRGLLVRELLTCPSAEAAMNVAIQGLEKNLYAGCNILCADASRAVILHAGDWLRVRPLPPGVHVLTNDDVNDPADARVTYALDWLNRRPLSAANEAMKALRQLCSQREPALTPICFRERERGTVSSSIVALRCSLTNSTYLHAQGPPDRTPYQDYSGLLHEMANQQGRGT